MNERSAVTDSPAARVHPVDERLGLLRLAVLGLQHVLVMYGGAVAVPLIVGRALGLTPAQVAMLISADLFCCGVVTLIQSLGVTRHVGVRLPVMMGVTFAAVGPMVAVANVNGGPEGARAIFGALIGAGLVSTVLAPVMGRLLRFFPPVVTGTIIVMIGINLMRVGIGWAMGGPASSAQAPDVDALRAMLAVGHGGLRSVPMIDNPNYAALDHLAVAALVLVVILLVVRYLRGFLANIAVLVGAVTGCAVAVAMGEMTFEKVAGAAWFGFVPPLAFGMPTFDIMLIGTMSLVMIVVMIESTGMFLALADITGRPLSRAALTAGLRVDGIGTLIGGLFNTFPYTSYSQNVGLVSVTGVKSRWVCVAGGAIMIVLGLLPKLAALVESVPLFVLGGAGLAMFGMVVASGIRILSAVDFRGNRHNLYIVAIAVGIGMIPQEAPRWTHHMTHAVRPLLESGILLTSIAAVVLNLFFNGGRTETALGPVEPRDPGGHAR
jgi:uracil-xanthine permease